MKNLIEVATIIIAFSTFGFASGGIAADKDHDMQDRLMKDSNPIFDGIGEVFSKTIEEDEEWFGHRALPFSMDYELLLIPEPVPVYYGKGKGKSKKNYGYAYGQYGYGKGKGKAKYGKKSKKAYDPILYTGPVHYIYKEGPDGSPKHSAREDVNMYGGH